MRSCVTPLSAVAGKRVMTIEATARDKVGVAVQAAWVRYDVAQCGYCQSGQVMRAMALLRRVKKLTDTQICVLMISDEAHFCEWR